MTYRKRTTAAVAAAALGLSGLAALTPTADATVTQNKTCTDLGGHLWTGHVTWGDTTNADGTISINPAGFKTSAPDTDGVDGSIKVYGAGSTTPAQTLTFTNQKFVDSADSDAIPDGGGGDWLDYNVVNPPSGAGAKVVMDLSDDDDGFGGCTITFEQPTTSYPATTPPAPTRKGSSCTAGATFFEGQTYWGEPQQDGIVPLTAAGFKTAATSVDYTITSYNGDGSVAGVQTETAKAITASTWFNRNPVDPTSNPGVTKVTIQVAPAGGTSCTMTITQPGTATTPPTVSLPANATATVENDPMPSTAGYADGDVADDSVVYPNGADTVVIGGSKATSGGGVYVDTLDGNRVQFLSAGQIGNIDLRTGFTLGSSTGKVLVAANRRDDNTARFWTLDPATKQLTAVGSIATGANYGGCLYKSVDSGSNNFYWNSLASDGTYKQFQLSGSTGSVTASTTPVRSGDVGGISEACVADDFTGDLYIGEEDVAIWKYSAHKADPFTSAARTQVDPVSGPNLVADIEGMDIVEGSTVDKGYLVVSSQGEDKYSVYQRSGTNEFVRRFGIVGSGTVDSVQETDGLSLAQGNLGTGFSQGVLVVHDHDNTGSKTGSSNLKFVPLEQAVDLTFP